MPFPIFAASVGVVSALLLAAWSPASTRWVPGACERLEPFLKDRIIGQDLAIEQLVDAVCTHIADGADPNRLPLQPLIISVHGPPGVGKTLTHTLLARALYNKAPAQATRCPGEDCRGAKVTYGLDFTHDQQQGQLAAVRAAVIDHVQSVPDPLIVIEEYDKLDCASRSMLRQLIKHPELANATFNRAIVLFESNLGFVELEKMLSDAGGDRTQIRPELAERQLKDAVFNLWRTTPCEAYQDTLQFTSIINFFLPYFPLQRPEVVLLMHASMRQWASKLHAEKGVKLAWDSDVVMFLTDKVDFDGPYPLEGATQVASIATRYLARIVRNCAKAEVHTSPTAWLSLDEGKLVYEMHE